jgi:hypothetical protein
MKTPKHFLLIGSAAAALLLLLVAGALAMRASVRLARVQADLGVREARWNELQGRRPFPSEENIVRLQREQTRLRAAVENLQVELTRRQYEPPVIEPAQFPLRLQTILRALHELALTNNVALPERFAFGFDRYARNLPLGEDLPRLSRQVQWVDEVSRALFIAQIRDLTAVERHVFEDEADRAAGTPGMPGGPGAMPSLRDQMLGSRDADDSLFKPEFGFLEDPEKLFIRERLIFRFTAREATVWKALNEMPRLPSFNIIAAIELVNEAPKPERVTWTEPRDDGTGGGVPDAPAGMTTPMPPMPDWAGGRTPQGGPAGPAPMPATGPEATLGGTNLPPYMWSTEQRVVAGRTDLVQVRLALDFYYFRTPKASGAEEQP